MKNDNCNPMKSRKLNEREKRGENVAEGKNE